MLSTLLFLILLSTGILSSQVFVCENDNLHISCPIFEIIHVDYAFFGRDSKVTCPKLRYDQNTQCSTYNATEIVQQGLKCEGQQNCTLSASIEIFGDPCYGVYKFLEVNYTCITQEVIQVIGCSGNIISLTCPISSVMQIKYADYGRHSTTLCPYPNPSAMQNTQCSMDETQKISNQCNGRQICDIIVDATENKDPCVGTYKYITVNYVCSEVPAGVETNVVGCGHAILSITCPTSTVIQVASADYGRHSTTLCPYPDSSAMQNTQCSLDETAKIAQKCNGNKTCIWSIDTTETIDPCYGTYKYVSVDYVCNPIGIVCGANEQYGCDNPCFRHCQHNRFCSSTKCTKRCICKDGYSRDSATGRCIDEKYCPLPSSNSDSHEVFSECNANCQASCSNPFSSCSNAPCVAGYVCAENYVRDNITTQCVRPANCTRV